MKYFSFHLKAEASLEKAWETLESKHFHLLYSDETPATQTTAATKVIYGHLPDNLSIADALATYPEIATILSEEFTEIDWNAQWKNSDPDSPLYFDLEGEDIDKNNGFYMRPGPGFGDLSHPTTRLMVKLLTLHARGKCVIDLGCGSGVLSLAAIKLGAKEAIGIDIDEGALIHATENALLNGLDSLCKFQTPESSLILPSDTPCFLVMNMISSEQEVALQSLPQLHDLKMECITTGILFSQFDEYIASCKLKNWELISWVKEGEWCAFHFICRGIK